MSDFFLPRGDGETDSPSSRGSTEIRYPFDGFVCPLGASAVGTSGFLLTIFLSGERGCSAGPRGLTFLETRERTWLFVVLVDGPHVTLDVPLSVPSGVTGDIVRGAEFFV